MRYRCFVGDTLPLSASFAAALSSTRDDYGYRSLEIASPTQGTHKRGDRTSDNVWIAG